MSHACRTHLGLLRVDHNMLDGAVLRALALDFLLERIVHVLHADHVAQDQDARLPQYRLRKATGMDCCLSNKGVFRFHHAFV